MTRAKNRRLAPLLAAATLLPVTALGWLGVRVLQQDRDIERQRQREHLDVAAGRLALDIERRLQERLPNSLSGTIREGVIRIEADRRPPQADVR